MIFSRDKCPLCGKQLWGRPIFTKTIKVIRYECDELSTIRTVDLKESIPWTHYNNTCYASGDMATMIIDGFYLAHFDSKKRTSVYLNSATMPPNFIYEIPLLDMDYTQPHAVVSRLNRLVPFS